MSQSASSSRPVVSPMPRTAAAGPNNLTKILDTFAGRILCIADIRGRLSQLNQLARENNAKAIIHTGDFGFYETSSLERINERTLKHLLMYSPLITLPQRNQLLAPEMTLAQQRQTLHNSNLEWLTEFPKLLSGQIKLDVPVFSVWGACEDVYVLEKFRMGIYEVENLHVLDEATTRCIDVGGVKLRLLGLGGALVPHKLFDNGDGQATIAGGMGTMWTTALQIGELVDTAQRVYDASETRLLVTHASPGREGLMAQLALVTKADLTISGGLHFRYATSYNEFSVQADAEGFRGKILRGKEAVEKIWESVKTQVESVVDDQQRILLEKFLSVIERVPPVVGAGPTPVTTEEPSWKNCWNWNLCDAAYGCLVLDVKEGRVSAELKSQGFNYAYRRTAVTNPAANAAAATSTPHSNASPMPTVASPAPAPAPKPSTPAAATPAATSSGQKSPSSEASPLPSAQKDDKPHINGHTSTAAAEKAEQKKKERKEKEKEKKDRQRAEREKEKSEKPAGSVDGTEHSAKPQAPKGSGKETPVHPGASSSGTPPPPEPVLNEAQGSKPSNNIDTELTSPITSPAGSTGNRTPTSKRAPRNPWTLFMKLPAPTTEQELRDFFQEAHEGITKINMPTTYYGKNRVAYIEFGDEDAMKTGLEKHAEKLNDQSVTVTIAEDRSHNHNANFRGGRGGRGFAQRGFAAAGLTHRKYSSGNVGGMTSDKKVDGGGGGGGDSKQQ